jgi:hypothetical protein
MSTDNTVAHLLLGAASTSSFVNSTPAEFVFHERGLA